MIFRKIINLFKPGDTRVEELLQKLADAQALLNDVAAGVDAVAADAKEEVKAELLQAYRDQQASESASEAAIEDLLQPAQPEE